MTSQHSANGRIQITPDMLSQSRRKEAFVLMGGPGVTQESILRSRISEREAQVENLNAQLREAKK